MNSDKLKSIIITEKLLMEGRTYRIGYKELTDDGLYVLNRQKDGTIKKYKVCDPIYVQETVENLDNGEHYLMIVNKGKRGYVKKKFPMDILIPQKLIGLLRYGIDIPPEFDKTISTYLLEQRKFMPHKLVYNNIGWNRDESGDLEFRLNERISNNSSSIALNDKDNLKFNLSNMGSLQRWLQMYKNEIKGHIPLEAIICISFSIPKSFIAAPTAMVPVTLGFPSSLAIFFIGTFIALSSSILKSESLNIKPFSFSLSL